jgi:hypothetical protein
MWATRLPARTNLPEGISHLASTSNHPDFTVRVDGAFDDAGTWVIDVKLTVREGLSREATARLRPVWSAVVRQGVALERTRGADSGASNFRLHLEHYAPGRFRRTRTRPTADV